MRTQIAIMFVLASTSTVAASDDGFGMLGLGTASTSDHQHGWMLRTEYRQDFKKDYDYDYDATERRLTGARMGFELWRAGDHLGFSVPMGFYTGALVGHTRMTVGGGFALWAFDRHDDETYLGFAPFASSSVELWHDKLLISLDVRLTRHLSEDTADLNVYSVMLMVGRAPRLTE